MKMPIATLLTQTLLVSLLASCAAPTAPTVPAALRVPASQTVSLEAMGKGVQIYACEPDKTDPTRFAWVFQQPEATLFDSGGKQVGKHYAGPTWESNDGSKVIGAVTARDDGPDATAIPWLLLTAKSTSGQGVFSATKSIQRLNTVGGKAPAEGCDRTSVGAVARVPYQATYYFYDAGLSEPGASKRSSY
jgi:hypothetical protein